MNMNKHQAARRPASRKNASICALIILITACVIMADNHPNMGGQMSSGGFGQGQSYDAQYGHGQQQYGYGMQQYGNDYKQAFKDRDLLQSDVKNCSDLNCKMEQCCVDAPRGAICVPLTVVNTTTGERRCVRPKVCNSDQSCFEDGCCVQNVFLTADTTCPDYPDYYKYPPHSFPGQIVKPKVGICLAKVGVANITCFMSITDNKLCPCGVDATGASLVCIPLFAGSAVGTCQLESSIDDD